jgi:hypothetical protein
MRGFFVAFYLSSWREQGRLLCHCMFTVPYVLFACPKEDPGKQLHPVFRFVLPLSAGQALMCFLYYCSFCTRNCFVLI